MLCPSQRDVRGMDSPLYDHFNFWASDIFRFLWVSVDGGSTVLQFYFTKNFRQRFHYIKIIDFLFILPESPTLKLTI